MKKAKEKGTKELTEGGIAGGPYNIDYKKGMELLKAPDLWKTPTKQEIADMKQRVAALIRSYDAVKTLGYRGSYTSCAKKIGAVGKPSYPIPGFGSGIDVHKAIGKLLKLKAGWTLPGYKYTGTYNDLENQVRCNPTKGEMLEIYDPPTGRTDAISICSTMLIIPSEKMTGSAKKADRKMVKALDNVPYNERQWGHWLARNIINTKQKLGLGVSKNGKSRRVKK